MTKDQIHSQLARVNIETTDQAVLTDQDFIDVYGNDETRKIGLKQVSRASLLAKIYNLNVTKEQSSYIFTRKS